MFDAIAQALASALAFFYDLVPNYAVAIALLTVAVMLLLFPLTAKGTRSMVAMQRLQPEMKRLQAQHKNDRQKLNEEMMALYKEHKVNPLGGCLPLLLQMPVFIMMFRVIRGLTSRDAEGLFDPRYVSHDSALYQALHGTKQMKAFGMDLSEAATSRHGSVLAALPFFALILVMVGAQYFQQRQLNARNPQASANPQAQMLQRVMPAFFGLISLSIPAGVVIYWLVSNVFRIGQQWAMWKFDPKATPVAPAPADGAKGGGPSAPKAAAKNPNDAKSNDPGVPAPKGLAAFWRRGADGVAPGPAADARPPRPAPGAKSIGSSSVAKEPSKNGGGRKDPTTSGNGRKGPAAKDDGRGATDADARPTQPRPPSGRVTPPAGGRPPAGSRSATRRTRKGR